MPLNSKVTERIISIRLESYSDSKNILLDFQYGFRKKRVYGHQLRTVIEEIFLQLGYPPNLIKLIQFFPIWDIKSKCQSFSTSCRVLAGVSQGSVLSPILFNIFSHPKLLTALYALISSGHAITYSSSHIQRHLSSLQNLYSSWRLQINENKSAIRHSKTS